jgi:hypothetical protein
MSDSDRVLRVITCVGFSDFYLPAHLPPGRNVDTAAELTAIVRRLMGSVSAARSAHAHCPVLVVSQDAEKDHGTNP